MLSHLVVLAVSAAPISVGPGFTGFEQAFNQKTDSDLGKKGMNDCGYAGITNAPVLSFTVAGVNDVVLELAKTSGGAVLVRGKQHLCLKPGAVDVEAGSYALHLLDSRDTPYVAAATVRLFSKAMQAKQAVASLPRVTLDGSGPNPLVFTTRGATPDVDGAVAGVSCARGRVQPVAELVVTQGSRFSIAFDGLHRELYVAVGGKCVVAGDKKPVDLEAGSAFLWMESYAKDARVTFTDSERALELAGADTPVVKLTTLPTVLRVRVPASKPRGSYEQVSFVGRTPTFVLEAGGPAEEISLRAIAGITTGISFDATGDLGTVSGNQSVHLKTAKKWFVFANSQKEGEVVLAFVDLKNQVLPVFWSPAPPSADLEPKDRVVAFHFPFWRLPGEHMPQILPLFATAPAELFVFVTKQVNDVPTSEPLLVLEHDGTSAMVVRATGEQVSVRAGLLTKAVPPAITLPVVKPQAPSTTTDDAWADAGPLETARVEAWVKRQQKWQGCIDDYMQKNDPAYGKSYELIYVRSGLNVSDVAYAGARKACGEAKFKADGDAFIKAINASHAKLASSIKGMLEKRLKH